MDTGETLEGRRQKRRREKKNMFLAFMDAFPGSAKEASSMSEAAKLKSDPSSSVMCGSGRGQGLWPVAWGPGASTAPAGEEESSEFSACVVAAVGLAWRQTQR